MATVITGGIDDFRALAYNTPSAEHYETFAAIGERYLNSLTTRAAERYENIREKFGNYSFSETRRRVRAVTRKVKRIFEADDVHELYEIGDFQHARSRMRRYVMSNPVVRQRYYSNRLEGYSDLYEDRYKGRIGEEDPLYRRVMSGVWQVDEDNNTYFEQYWEDEEMATEEPITQEEQLDVLSSWDRVLYLLNKMEEDPTSPYNQML